MREGSDGHREGQQGGLPQQNAISHPQTCFCGLVIVHVLRSADMAASGSGSAQLNTDASQASPRLKSRMRQASVAWRSECLQSGLHWQRALTQLYSDDRCAGLVLIGNLLFGSSLAGPSPLPPWAPANSRGRIASSSPALCQAAAPWVPTSTSRSCGRGSRRAPPCGSISPAWQSSTANGLRSSPLVPQPPSMH